MSDITDFGFDPSLNIPSKDTGTPLIYDGVSDAIQAQQLASGGNLTLKNLTISGISKMVAPGDDLQQALNEINAAGGGTLLMKAGTYTQRTPLTGYSNTSIEGISTSSTIINFQGSANLSFTGTQVYTTGTVTGIASNVIVSGSGTAWLTKAAAGMQIFLGTRWYLIGSVINDTTLILSEGYGDNLTFPVSYRIANPIVNLILKEITLQNSTGTALAITDERTVILQNVKAVSNNVGMAFTNVSEYDFKNVYGITSTSDGMQITNVGLGTVEGMITAGNGGNGVTLNNVKTAGYSFCSSDANVGDGVNMTTVVGCEFAWECSGNGGQGIEMVANCSSNFVNPCVFTGNTSDGLKLTSNCDGNILGPLSATSNGGYGINIASSTDDNNTIVVPYFSGNSSGTYNDSGTNTNVVATITGANIQIFSSNGTWTKPSTGSTVTVTCIGGGGGGGGGNGSGTGFGGSGGGGGAYVTKNFNITNLSATAAVTVATTAAGGTGGVGGNGSNGTAGGTTSFGSYVTAYGGGRGAGGNGAGNTAGGGGGGSGGAGGNSSVGTTATTGGVPATTSGSNGIAGQGAGSVDTADGKAAESGGGGGGGYDNVTTLYKGGDSISGGGGGGSGGMFNNGNGAAGGGTGSYSAGNGAIGSAPAFGGSGSYLQGGGGGGGGNLTTGYAGGAGGTGGGGGGGGATSNNGTAGAGGAGGAGQVIVITS